VYAHHVFDLLDGREFARLVPHLRAVQLSCDSLRHVPLLLVQALAARKRLQGGQARRAVVLAAVVLEGEQTTLLLVVT